MNQFRYHTRIQSGDLDRASLSHADILAISCSDFRFIDIAHAFLQPHKNNYDQVVIPGASGAIQMGNWEENLLEQIEILVELHGQNTVYIMDHQDCGLYKAVYGKEYDKNMLGLHQKNLLLLRSYILQVYPDMNIFMFLFLLDGTILQLVE